MDEEEFTHAIDVSSLQKDTGKTIREIAEACGVNVNAVYKWGWARSSHGNRPKYEAIKKLLEMGATTETLFGITLSEKPKEATQDQIMEQVKKALKDLIQK